MHWDPGVRVAEDTAVPVKLFCIPAPFIGESILVEFPPNQSLRLFIWEVTAGSKSEGRDGRPRKGTVTAAPTGSRVQSQQARPHHGQTVCQTRPLESWERADLPAIAHSLSLRVRPQGC